MSVDLTERKRLNINNRQIRQSLESATLPKLASNRFI